ncbi:Tudor/PWWP/MBT superfamily protein [Raphanus sativus]|uniref:Sister chromatid cohesion protein PDS5 homolog D isoform X1 n=1 Tax=Raphanus sativus TaxID=3726 RepID=A0A6J0LCS3_RAPSA|nr:sister chromatid cohesion protein PDS5 homolog D isoform X1 [Raphanus sativus]KAJ4874380.1 Tudor/PWWP/MBT superfamily protein [Raphanus sativus]
MACIVGLNHLAEALIDAGNRLLSPPSSTDELLTLLDETECLLRKVEQDQPLSMQNALIPSKNALVSSDLLSHTDSHVRVSLVSCLTEIVRITAPEAPYTDDQMKEIFRLTIEAFEKLADASSRSYQKAESVLDNVSKVKSCLVLLDLECHDLILQMFHIFLKIIRSDHPRVVFSSMEMIMITLLDETEEVSTDMLTTLLASVKKDNQNVSPMAWSLVEKVLSRCARKLKPYIMEALKSTGASLDTYSPVVTTICQTVFETPKVHNVVDTKENEDKLVLGHSRKETRSKSGLKKPARDGTPRISENEKSRNGKQVVWSESRDAETELGVTGKRGRKPNSLMNPEEGYDIPWLSGKRDYFKTCSSNKKLQRKGSGGGESSLEKLAAKRTPPAKESSPATTSRALTGSVKRSRVKMEDIDHDLDSPSSPKLKKLASCFRDEEPVEKEPNQESYEIPEDDRKIGESSKRTKSQNGGKKKAIVNSSGKRSSARTAAKKKNLEGASWDTPPVPQSSKDKKKVSQVASKPLAEESEETSKSQPKRRKEVESDKNGFGEDLVGKRVKVWWPLDKTFYEGVIDSYCSRKKTHGVAYTNGDSEELYLVKERWELLEDLPSASEKKKSQVAARPLAEESEENSKSHQVISRTTKKEVGSGEDLVGKRVNIWWPLDKTFYEGVVESYSSHKNKHTVVYTDGESEQLNLVKERWELLEDPSSASEQDMEIDLPESVPLFDIMQKVKKSKNVESSSKKDSGKKAREGKNLKSLKELSAAETGRREEEEVSRDVDEESEDEYYNSEMQESEENLKVTETEAKEDEKQFQNPEVESDRDGSESEEEPKWRETDDLEDEAEEGEEADNKVPKSTSQSEIEKDSDEERGS